MTIQEIIEQLDELKEHCEYFAEHAIDDDDNPWKKDVEALEESIKLWKKEVPKKVDVTEPLGDEDSLTAYRCPKCGSLLGNDIYCSYCGQKLDWSDEND